MLLPARVLAVPFSLLMLLAPFAIAYAGWPNSTTEHVPLCTAAEGQTVSAMLPDGSGGAIVAWSDGRNGHQNIYARRVTADGVPVWTANGVPISVATSWKGYVQMVSDGADGAILAWADDRNGTRKIYAQRLGSNGKVVWATNGVPVATTTSLQANPDLVSDGAGGVIVIWQDYRSGSNQLYAQRLDSSGAQQWASSGVAVCTAAVSLQTVSAIESGSGGAIVVWEDSRSGNRDLYGQLISATGATFWTTNGEVICDAADTQNLNDLVSDGAAGAFIAWEDYRTGTGDIYVQRIDHDGASQWTADGVAVTSLASAQYAPALALDGGNGVFVAWMDTRYSPYDVYAQRISESGAVQWAANGVAVTLADGVQQYPQLCPDGAGGVLSVWEDHRFYSSSLYAQRINSSGAMQWTANGIEVCRGTLGLGAHIVPDGVGGFVSAWGDGRDQQTSGYDIYAQHVDAWGYLGAQPIIAGIGDVRGDQGGLVRLSWYASPLDGFPTYSIYAYDIYRAVPADAALRAVRAGRALVDAEDGALPTTPGTLLRRATTNGVQFWEYLESVTARHLSGYSYLATTTCDSMPGANPYTSFMVVARNSGTTRWWCSDPDSGYSTDDLAPVAPAPFAGAYASGTSTLLWGANGEGDLAGYRLYRGSSSTFVPGPANLVLALTGTSHADASGAPCWYKLTAVDVHGNESPPATLLPNGTLAVDGDAPPLELSLSGPAPHPSRGATTLQLALPRATHASLTVFDAQGRRVRALLDGAQPAGVRAVRWDGRDDRGRTAPSGLYLVRAEVEGRSFHRRVILLH